MKSVEPAEVPEDVRRLGLGLPPGIRLGGSTWSFPGWMGLVWGGKYSESRLAHEGLAAYAQHPLLRGVGLDRTYYQPLEAGNSPTTPRPCRTGSGSWSRRRRC